MDLTPFTTSPCAARRDGWSPERKLRFLDRLAAGGNVRAACAAVGMTREAAYALRRRDALFARGWAAALLPAREAGAEVLADKATEGIDEEVWYRGELVGTRRRFDARLLLAHIARLDRMAEEATAGAAEDATRFDEILACIAEAEAPEELQLEEDSLPLARDAALAMAEDHAAAAVDEAWAGRDTEPEDEDEPLSDEDYARYMDERRAAAARARAEAGAQWDGWFERACRQVDDLIAGAEAERDAAAAVPGTVSDVSSSPAAATAVGPNGRRYAYA